MAERAILEAGQQQAADGSNPAADHGRSPRKWRCLNCGQLVFTAAYDEPPDLCQCCKDMTTWQALHE